MPKTNGTRSLRNRIGENVRILAGSNVYNGRKEIRSKSGKVKRTAMRVSSIRNRMCAMVEGKQRVKEDRLILIVPQMVED